MYEHNQVEIPPAFMALYSRNGHPVESREFVEARLEACDDLAHGLTAFCSQVHAQEDLPEDEVLRRCHAGLVSLPDAHAGEAAWVIGRTAELLGWPPPEGLAPPCAPG